MALSTSIRKEYMAFDDTSDRYIGAFSYADNAVNATVQRALHGRKVALNSVYINHSAAPGAAYLQQFNAQNPNLGTAWADQCFYIPNSIHALIEMTGDNEGGTRFGTCLSYALTDAAHGAALTGGNRAGKFEVSEL